MKAAILHNKRNLYKERFAHNKYIMQDTRRLPHRESINLAQRM